MEELNEKWDIHKVVDAAVRGALHYEESSKQSAIAIATLTANQENIMEKLEELVKRFDSFEEKLDKALEKKANVWVEKFMVWAGIIIGAGILGYLGSLIIKVIELK